MVVAAVYILYLLFLVVRACSELRHMPYVGKSPVTDARAAPAPGPQDLQQGHGRDSGPCGQCLGPRWREAPGWKLAGARLPAWPLELLTSFWNHTSRGSGGGFSHPRVGAGHRDSRVIGSFTPVCHTK